MSSSSSSIEDQGAEAYIYSSAEEEDQLSSPVLAMDPSEVKLVDSYSCPLCGISGKTLAANSTVPNPISRHSDTCRGMCKRVSSDAPWWCT